MFSYLTLNDNSQDTINEKLTVKFLNVDRNKVQQLETFNTFIEEPNYRRDKLLRLNTRTTQLQSMQIELFVTFGIDFKLIKSTDSMIITKS